jgi:transposase
VALPNLTDEQRTEALKKAAESRKEVLAKADTDPITGKMKVSALLEALPKIGKVKALEIMTELEIAPTRRLRGLGARQRRDLLTRFGYAD